MKIKIHNSLLNEKTNFCGHDYIGLSILFSGYHQLIIPEPIKDDGFFWRFNNILGMNSSMRKEITKKHFFPEAYQLTLTDNLRIIFSNNLILGFLGSYSFSRQFGKEVQDRIQKILEKDHGTS